MHTDRTILFALYDIRASALDETPIVDKFKYIEKLETLF
jgi:hypothetical protein